MNRNTARIVADALTWTRIVSVVPITVLAWYELRWWVLGIYIAAALTDLLDGMFARRGTPPKSDIDFDGIADLVFRAMALVWLWLLIPDFFPTYWLPYFPVLVVLELYMLSVRIRKPKMAVPHFEFGRVAMTLFFALLPVLIIWGDVPWFVHLVLVVATASTIQLTWAIARSGRGLQ